MSRNSTITLGCDRLPPEAIGCLSCIDRVQNRLALVQGVRAVEFLEDKKAIRLYLDDAADAGRIERSAIRVMQEVAAGLTHDTFRVGGMDCPGCAREIEIGLTKLPGVSSCTVDFATARMKVEYDRARTDAERIRQEVRKLGFSASSLFDVEAESSNLEIITLGVGGALWVIASLEATPDTLRIPLFVLAGLVSGWKMLLSGLFGLSKLAFTMNTLMAVAVIGAAAVGEWSEASSVAWLFSLGTLLQARTYRRTRAAISSLAECAPKTARVRRDGKVLEMDVRQVQVGDEVEILPHAHVSVDGTVVEGISTIDNSALTGEPEPCYASTGSKVLTGGINGQGRLVVRADVEFADTTYARTLDLIEKGQSSRSKRQELIDRFSAWYTPTVIGLAALYAVAGPLLFSVPWEHSLRQAFWLLMVSCPCALVISTPVATVAAIGAATKHGALVKGGSALEALASIRHWVFDKTGTLTHARLEVEKIVTLRGDQARWMSVAATLAEQSSHPVSRAISRFVTEAERLPATQVRDIAGSGMVGVIGSNEYRLGSAEFVETNDRGGSRTYLSEDGEVVAIFELGDQPKRIARESVQDLHKLGAKITLLSGDDEHAVRSVAEGLSADDWKANVKPDEKAHYVESLSNVEPVAMVGDGINDVAALQRANVAVAMGAAGSEAAIESAEIVVLNDSLAAIPWLVRLSRRYRAILLQNVSFSLATKAGLIVAGLLWTDPPYWVAVAGDMGVSLLVTLNALRLRA